MITPSTGEAFLKLRLKDQAAALKLLDDDPNLKGVCSCDQSSECVCVCVCFCALLVRACSSMSCLLACHMPPYILPPTNLFTVLSAHYTLTPPPPLTNQQTCTTFVPP